jgi:hypothetical protein
MLIQDYVLLRKKYVLFCTLYIKFGFDWQISLQSLVKGFMQIRPVENKLFILDKQKCENTDMKDLIVAFSNVS